MPVWTARRVATAVAIVTLLAACDRIPSAPEQPYNVLVISLDSARQDALGVYGRRPALAPTAATSPGLDRLAGEGVRLLDAYASAPWTMPSHMSMMTGQPTLVHGAETFFQTLDDTRPLLAEVLRSRGYRTVGVFSGPYLEPHWGFGRGFERYQAVYGQPVLDASREAAELRAQIADARARHDDAALDALMLRQQDVYQRVEQLSERDATGEQVTAAAVAELDALAPGNQPWFLFAHYFDPHYDYVPPPPYDTRFDPDYGGVMTGVDFIHNPAVAVRDPEHPDDWIRHVGDRDLAHLVALYEGEIAATDAHVAALLARLDTLGVGRRTLVVVVGDHGDEFFEHGGIGHHRTLYEEAVRVPMLFRLPDVLPAGAAVHGPVSVADLMPTVLDLLHVPIPAGLGASSLVPLLQGRGGAPGAFARLVTLRPGSATLDGRTVVTVRQVTVQEAYWRGHVKITRRRSWPQFAPTLAPDVRAVLQREADAQFGREELRWVDLTRAPAEREGDQSTDFVDAAARAALTEFRTRYRDMASLRTAPRSARPPDDVVHKLQGLGYVDGSAAEFWAESPDAVLPLPGAG